MIRRIGFDLGAVILMFLTPWWVVFIYVVLGAIFFSWYGEAIFLGLFFDVMYGASIIPWYQRFLHVGIFIIPVLISEFIKPKINV